MNSSTLIMVAMGISGAFLFKFMHVPGGYMLGAVVGCILAKYMGFNGSPVPSNIYGLIQIAIGISVGSMFNIELVSVLKGYVPQIILSTSILLIAGLISAILAHYSTGLDAISSVLATTPGGLNACIGFNDNPETNPQIMAFQMVRLYVVIICMPIFCWIIKFFVSKV